MIKKTVAVLSVLFLAACDSAPDGINCAGYKIIELNETTARIITPDDRYFTLYRTESLCGYRYAIDNEYAKINIHDNCTGDWVVSVGNDTQVSCK